MLKRLELIGFKSFAEKTQFDFPAGVTAIVGPNGSGKSNIVDAVRWILGEQSAKSLRGGEMADVIFNGSSSRKSLGMAEVTMSFDNSRRVLNLESDEVQITRRVYRDGTGEYLINHQLSRLKDIKEMFLGSGAGTTAYCIIEQGRVDALLQASTKDRRNIFEEAAGISRFKAKKLETLRKLENVEQNLARVRDIVAEVEKQRRRLDIEASKARRFQEYSLRLRELRLGLSLREFGQATLALTTEAEILDRLRNDLGRIRSQLTDWESEIAERETTLAATELTLERLAVQHTETLRAISTLQAEFDHEGQNAETASQELNTLLRRKLDLAQMIRSTTETVYLAESELREAILQADRASHEAKDKAEALLEVERQLAAIQRQVQQDRFQQVDLVRQAGTLQTQAEATKLQLDRFERERDQRRRKSEQREAELQTLDRVLEDLSRTDADLQLRLQTVRDALQRHRDEQDQYRRGCESIQQVLENLRVRRSELRGRVEILEGLERSQEGLGTGVREVVALIQADTEKTGLASIIIGLIADCLSVPTEMAPLIDLVLGETAQRFVVRNADQLDDLLAKRDRPFAGRVGFLPLLPMETDSPTEQTSTADRWVSCDHPELAGLPRQLLGQVWIVPDLATARQLASDTQRSGFRFVTQQGELLESDGSLTVGIHHAEGGILSRKSELRDLRAKATALEGDIAAAEQHLADLRLRLEGIETPIHGLEQEIDLLANRAGDLQTRIIQQKEQRTRIEEEIGLYQVEMNLMEQEIRSLETAWHESRAKAEQAEQSALALKLRLEQAEHAIRTLDGERVRLQEESTTSQIGAAQLEERLAGLRSRFQQQENDLRRGREEFERVERHETILRSRRVESELAILNATASLAHRIGEKERLQQELAECIRQRDLDRDRRKILTEQLQTVRGASQEQLTQLHHRELAVRDLENTRSALIDRLREDYQIDLAEEFEKSKQPPVDSESGAESSQDSLGPTESLQTEISQLKEKIRRLGNVSLESLQELADVEARAQELHGQLNDLSTAHRSLLEIIDKINTDSRKLFVEAYDQIRTHFQELFRKLFGGGMADVILENPDDVLESGIEIVARPPGKELRGISLMSGGEKTMTAVALLLAIFRSKPSPFCLLDEVDAALDEANTARLGNVLREFLDHSQFIIITHKKRTMAIADVLYGITMQESGVSKQVAVRFEDWPEDQPLAA